MYKLLMSAIQNKMEKLERKLIKYASVFFGNDVVIMYIPKENMDKCKPEDGG